MLDVLRRRNQARVQNVVVWLLLDQLAALFDQTFHTHALLPARTHAQLFADLLEIAKGGG